MSPDPQRIAIVGNSNSIIHNCYAEMLSRHAGFSITNFSIGGCPNSVILRFLSAIEQFEFDFIIIETSVMDCDMAFAGYLDEPRIKNTLSICLAIIRRYSAAKIILLVLPIRAGMIEPDRVRVSKLSHEAAAEFGAYVFDLYVLMGQLSGHSWHGFPPGLRSRAGAALECFALGADLVPTFLWQPALSSRFNLPPLARHMFLDDLHISFTIHELIDDILSQWISKQTVERTPEGPFVYSNDRPVTAQRSLPHIRSIDRTSSLISQTFRQLTHGETICFDTAPDYRPVALVVNRSQTCGVVRLEGDAGHLDLDLRFGLLPREYTAIVVPIEPDIGGGPFRLTVTSGAGKRIVGQRFWHVEPDRTDAYAEVADLILIKRQPAPLSWPRPGAKPDFLIHCLPWVESRVRKLAKTLGVAATSAETGALVGPRRVLERAIALIGSDTAPPVSQARLYLAVGDVDGAIATVMQAIGESTGSADLRKMIAVLEDLRSELLAAPA